MQKFLVFSGIGLELGALLFIAFLIGRELDQRFETGGLFFLGFAFLALITWFIQVLWLLKRINQADQQK